VRDQLYKDFNKVTNINKNCFEILSFYGVFSTLHHS